MACLKIGTCHEDVGIDTLESLSPELSKFKLVNKATFASLHVARFKLKPDKQRVISQPQSDVKAFPKPKIVTHVFFNSGRLIQLCFIISL